MRAQRQHEQQCLTSSGYDRRQCYKLPATCRRTMAFTVLKDTFKEMWTKSKKETYKLSSQLKDMT